MADHQDSPPPQEASPFGQFEQEPVLQRGSARRPNVLRNPAVAGLVLALLVASPLVVAGLGSPADSGSGAPADDSLSAPAPPDRRGDGGGSDYSMQPGTGSPQPQSDLIGTWSGVVTDDAGGSTAESVTITVDTFDGFGDGTLETQLGESHCTEDLAWATTDGDTEVFEATDPEGECVPSTVRLEHDSSDDTVRYVEEWERAGEPVSYSGWLERR
jgi:hypothetical protein